MEHNYNEQFHGKEIAARIQLLKTQLKQLEAEYQETDPAFAINPRYNYLVVNGRVLFATINCKPELEQKMKAIACQVLY